MDAVTRLIILAEGKTLDLGGDFAQWAPGGCAFCAARRWLKQNRLPYIESETDDLLRVSKETAEKFYAAWAR